MRAIARSMNSEHYMRLLEAGQHGNTAMNTSAALCYDEQGRGRESLKQCKAQALRSSLSVYKHNIQYQSMSVGCLVL